MTNWGSYTGGSSGGSSNGIWGDYTQPHYAVASGGAKKPSGGTGGLLGLAENFGGDVYHTVTDMPAGFAAIGHQISHDARNYLLTNPISYASQGWSDPHSLFGGLVKPWFGNEKHIYGSALHGNFHPLYEHPLTPVLDAATVLSFGGAGALKGAEIGAFGNRAAEFARAPRILQSERLAEPLNTARTVQGRLRQNAFDRFSVSHPDTPLVGANPRLAQISTVRAYRNTMRAMIPVGQFRRLVSPLTRDERTALHIGAEGVPLAERIAYYKGLPQTHLVKRYLNLIQKPGIRKVLEDPRPQFVDALNGAKALEEKASQRLIESGGLTQEIRDQRAQLPQRVMREGEPTLANAVHPALPEPFRFPHASGETSPGLYTAPKGAPLGKVKDLGQLRKNTGARLRSAAVATDPEQWARDFLQTQRHEELLQMQHGVLDKVAKPLDEQLPGGKLPGEHYYRPSYARKSTTPIGRPVQEQAALARDFETATAQESKLAHTANESVFTDKNAPADVREALQSGDIQRLNGMGVQRVPDAFGKRYTSTFGGTGAKTRFFIDRPLDVWRAVTLNLRPAWMVNNLVGNNLMFFLRHPDGAATYLRTLLRTERGDAKVSQLWKWTIKHPTIRRKYERVFQEVAPEIHGSGLYGSQVKLTKPGVYQGLLDRSSALRAAKAIAVPAKLPYQALRGVGRGITFLERHIAEDAPREAAMMRELQPFVKRLKRAGMSTEQALKSLDPRDVELAVDRVNDALGDFNSLSPTERRVVRRFIPFWSWYRVIVAVSAKYAARYPARVNLINAISQQAAAEDKSLPSWLQGEIQLGPVKGGVQPVLTTPGINPYQTLPQLGTSNPLGMLNPFIGGIATGLTGKDTFGGDYKGWGSQVGTSPNLAGYLKRSAGAFAYDTVPGQLGLKLTGNAHNSKIYAPKTYGHIGPVPINDALLQYLGLPIRHVRVKQAKIDKGKGY